MYGAVRRWSLGIVVAVASSNSLTSPTWRQFLCPTQPSRCGFRSAIPFVPFIGANRRGVWNPS
jgi:hypothetical protein